VEYSLKSENKKSKSGMRRNKENLHEFQNKSERIKGEKT